MEGGPQQDRRNAFRPALQQSLALLRHAADRYQDMIVKDPDFTSKLETVLRVASYIIPEMLGSPDPPKETVPARLTTTSGPTIIERRPAYTASFMGRFLCNYHEQQQERVIGRLGGSWELSELAYSISNLYSLGNDYIIARKCPAASKISKCSKQQQRLLWYLSLLDTVEVAMEVMTQRFAGEPAKWGVVILLQIIRAALRSLLVFRHGHGLQCTPSVPPPDRKKAAQEFHAKSVDNEGEPLAWKAPRTGKVIRSIHADDSVPYSQLHHYVAPPSPPAGRSAAGMADSAPRRSTLTSKQLLAEALYIARPLAHIFSMFLLSEQSWKPWLLSLAMDIASLQLLGAATCYSNSLERSEVVRRRVTLLLYLLRSPFYDVHAKSFMTKILKALSEKLPLAHFVVEPLLEYLPVWQQIYSYNWMT